MAFGGLWCCMWQFCLSHRPVPHLLGMADEKGKVEQEIVDQKQEIKTLKQQIETLTKQDPNHARLPTLEQQLPVLQQRLLELEKQKTLLMQAAGERVPPNE